MRLALLISALGITVGLGGCANRLPTTSPNDTTYAAPPKTYTVVRTTAVGCSAKPLRVAVRPAPVVASSKPRTSYPAPPPASLEVLRRSKTLPQARRTVIAPKSTDARVQPAVSAPSVPTASAPANTKAIAPCVRHALYTTKPVYVLDPCAGGRCGVPK